MVLTITPTEVNLTVGQSEELSCDVSGGESQGWVKSQTVFSSKTLAGCVFHGTDILLFIRTTTTLYKSTDSGENFLPILNKVPSLDIRQPAIGNGVIIVPINNSANLLRSTDGFETYSTITIPNIDTPVQSWSKAIYANGKFFLICTNSRVAVSHDLGLTWSIIRTNDYFTPYDIVFFANKWVFVGGNIISSSANLSTWVNYTVTTTSFLWFAVILGGKIAVGAYETDRKTWTSTDLVTWQINSNSLPADRERTESSTYYGGKGYITQYISGKVLETTDGVNWSLTVATGAIYASEQIIASDAGLILLADNGANTWTKSEIVQYSKTLIDTSDSSVLSTVSPYTYVADLADDGKNFQWSVTDGVSTVESALIPVNTDVALAFTDTPTDQSVTSGGMLDLRWVVTGGSSSAYIVELSFNSVVVAIFSNLTGVFEFSRLATMDDNGTFTCRITNGGEEVTDSISVTVASAFSIPRTVSLDLGMGYGVPITKCNLSQDTLISTDGMFTYEAPSVFSVVIPFCYDPTTQEAIPYVSPAFDAETIVRITSETGSVIEFPAAIVYGKMPYEVRSDQRSYKTCSGRINTMDGNLRLRKGELRLKNVSKTDGALLETFILDTLNLNENTFTLECFSKGEVV